MARNESIASAGALDELASRARSRRGLLRSLLAGTVLLAVWLALWTWLVAGVVRPLAGAESALRGQAAAVEGM
jgi:hypothetical protein